MSTRHLCAAVLFVVLTASALTAQTFVATEFFVVPDYRAATSGGFSWDNAVLDDLSGTPTSQYVITFDNQLTIGLGTYGSQYTEGDYVLEACWFVDDPVAPVQPGHMHFQLSGGNPGAFDRSHFNVSPDQLQGFRVARTDGAPFQLVSLDYRQNDVPLLVGTSFTAYDDICAWNRYDASNGLVMSSWQWLTFAFTGIAAPVPGPGQPHTVGSALLDVNTAVNANGNPAVWGCPDANGPFFADATPGGPLTFTFAGQPNRPVVLAAGPLNPDVANYPVGQLDIGLANPSPPFIPFGIQIVVDGTHPGILNGLFNTGPAGVATVAFTTPGLPPGVFTTFQAAIFDGSSLAMTLSNAVQVSIN